ncbi:MAG: PTS lactose/cellobiose transporter subunit IIA [Atopobium sp.]|jgi:PTS system cellobiose-specific IIA component|nr:PTS lactose/cellobiose transporter subunit IIA [Atopobium sp.]
MGQQDKFENSVEQKQNDRDYADCFQIIAEAGQAKSDYIAATHAGIAGNFEKAKELIRSGNEAFDKSHMIHLKLLQLFASGENCQPPSVLLVHAEDQMSSAEVLRAVADDFILYCARDIEKNSEATS